MLIAIVDTETTGTDASRDHLLEVACVTYCTTSKRVVRQYSALVKTLGAGVTVAPEITAINGITADMVEESGVELFVAMERVLGDISGVRTVFAHNASFDKGFLEKAAARVSVLLPPTPWLDTRTQVPYPESMKSKRLIHLAAEHGVQIRPAHEAMSDCLMLLDVLKNYDIERLTTMVEYRRSSALKLAPNPVDGKL